MANNLATIKKVRDAQEVISKEEFAFRVNELKRCKEDIIYFAEKYFRIISLKDGLTIIKPFDKQRDMINFFKNNKRVCCLSSRQSGKTTNYTIFCLWTVCFFPDKSIMLAANKASTAIEILGRIRRAYEYLPEWLKPAVTTYNKSTVVYSNNSNIHAFATASDACRSYSANIVVLDEFAFVPQNVAESFFSSVYPVVSTDPNSHVIIVSTANTTVNNLYYDIWCQANQNEDKTTGWQAFRMDWWDVPGRDEEWKKHQIASIGLRRFSTEFGNEFIAGATSKLLPDYVIEKQQRNTKKCHVLTIKSSTGQNDWHVKIYNRPEIGHVYIAGADISEGIGANASCLVILDITNIHNISVVAVFSSKYISITEFTALSARILNAYNTPLLLAENNGVGAGCLSLFNDAYKYPRILSHNEKSLGIHSTNKTKLEACMWLRELMTSDEFEFKLNDSELVTELSYFSRTNSSAVISYAAPKGLTDDLVMALCWAVFLIKPEYLKFGVNVLETGKTKLGVEIPTVISIDLSYDNILAAFQNDKLAGALLNMTDDVDADWYFSNDETNNITTVIQSTQPVFVVNNGHAQNIYDSFDDDDGTMW